MIKVISAAPGARRKRHRLFESISEIYRGCDFSSITYIVPNGFVSTLVGREFFRFIRPRLKGGAYIPFQAVTMQQLASEIADRFMDRRPVSDSTFAIVIDRLSGNPAMGFSSYLSDLNKKLRHFRPGLPLQKAIEEAKSLIHDPKTSDRAAEALSLIGRCRDLLDGKGALDPAAAIEGSISFLEEALAGRTIVIDGFIDPTPLEREFIAQAVIASSRTFIAGGEDDPFLSFIRARFPEAKLERLPGVRRAPRPPYYRFPSAEDEVEGLAAMIKDAISGGTRPWEIAVTFPGLTSYLPMVKRVFERYGIPVNAPVHPATLDPRAVVVEDILACIENDYPRINMLSVMTSPFLRIMPDGLRDRAVSFAYRAGIIKGKDSWLAISKTLLRLGSDENDKGSGEIFSRFGDAVESVIASMEKIRRAESDEGFLEELSRWLHASGFFDEGLDGDTETPNRVIDMMRDLADAVSLSGGGRPAQSPAAYLRFLLRDGNAPSAEPDGVNLVPYELAAVSGAEMLFAGGMTEEALPSRPMIDPLLPERVKKALGLPDIDYYLERQSRYFGLLVNEPAMEPVFSCPEAEGDKVFLPSPLLDWEGAMTPPADGFRSMAKRPAGKPPVAWNGVTFTEGASSDAFSARLETMLKRGISVTDIDSFRKCPMRFYIERILGFEPVQPPRFEVHARLWGNIAHRTMELLFEEGDVPPEEIGDRLRRCLETSLRDFPVWRFWQEVARRIFQRLAAPITMQERLIREMGFSPIMLEQRLSGDLGGWKIRGKIDRIDGRGEDEGVMLLDYKTGEPDGKSLQLPLYAYLWRQEHPSRVEAAGFYSLKNGRVTWQPGKRKDMDTFIEEAVSAAASLLEMIKEGRFMPEPDQASSCRFCGHDPLCGRNS